MPAPEDLPVPITAWLTRGHATYPVRSLENALAQVAVTPQHPPGWRSWSLGALAAPAMWSAASVALIAVLVAAMVLPRQTSVLPDTASPTPSAAISAATPIPFQLAGPDPDLPEGSRYLVGPPFPVTITFQVPAGWEYTEMAHDFAGVDANMTAGFAFLTPQELAADPCRWHGGWRRVTGAIVSDLVDALRALPHAEVADPVSVMISGHPGWEITRVVDKDLSACDEGRMQQVARPAIPVQPGEYEFLYVLDVHGTVLVIEAWSAQDALERVAPDLARIRASLILE